MAHLPTPLIIEKSHLTDWCWAAVARAVAQWYSQGAPTLSQCEIATEVKGLACCKPENHAACNGASGLSKPLRKVGHNGETLVPNIALSRLEHELAGGRPAALLLVNDKGGHFVAVYSATIEPGNKAALEICDPAVGGIPIFGRFDGSQNPATVTIPSGRWNCQFIYFTTP